MYLGGIEGGGKEAVLRISGRYLPDLPTSYLTVGGNGVP